MKNQKTNEAVLKKAESDKGWLNAAFYFGESMKIVKSREELSVPCETVDDIDGEGMDIADKLFQVLDVEPGIGLAANQVGINKRVCVISVPDRDGETGEEQYYRRRFINPEIIEKKDPFIFTKEGCLSFPNKVIHTMRFHEVVVKCSLNHSGIRLKGLEAVVAQHECLPYFSEVVTENGKMKIANLSVGQKVLSLDKNGKVSFKNVVAFSKKRVSPNTSWLLLNYGGPYKGLTCTDNHLCAVVDHILKPEVTFLASKNCIGKYLVRKPDVRERNPENALYNSDQISMIVGGLLGDSCISKAGEICVSHGEPQQEYARFKAEILGGKIIRGYSGYRDEFSNYMVKGKVTEQTKYLRKISYIGENARKMVKNLLSLVDDKALAIWYMDDGCLTNKNGKTSIPTLHTEGFSYNDVCMLVALLRDKFGLDCFPRRRKEKVKEQYIIVVRAASSDKFFATISPYIDSSMYFKLPEKFRNVQSYSWNSQPLDFAVRKVKQIKVESVESSLYDIEVEDNHCFFADGTLVHNCDHTNGIVMYQRSPKNIGVNNPCPCDSGKKFKKCCMKNLKMRELF